jgi:predicted lipoprotein
MSEDRRRSYRRSEDRQRVAALGVRPHVALRRAAIGLLCVVTVVLIFVVVALAISDFDDNAALGRSVHALKQAESALQSARSAAASARQALSQSVQTQQLTAAIQQNRVESCQAGNARHAASVKQLERLLSDSARRARTRLQRAEVAASRRSILPLIDAVAPEQNCSKLSSPTP